MASNRARWTAPGRVTLIGDHTDYTEGFALPCAIDRATTVEVTLNGTGMLLARSTRYPDDLHQRPISDVSELLVGWAAYVDGAVHLLSQEGVQIAGATVSVESDIPPGAGLSSSAALVCATLSALLEASGHQIGRTEVARLAQRVENEYLGAPVGFMDPAVVMMAEAGHAVLIDCRTQGLTHLPMDLAAHGLALLVADTGEPHSTTGVVYRERVVQCADAAHLLGVATLRDVTDPATVELIDEPVLRARARHVVTENRRVLEVAELLGAGRLPEVGPHLIASHDSLRDDYGVSTAALDLVVDTALGCGALGARMTGAGLGGSVLVLAEQPVVAQIASTVQKAMADRGFGAPEVVSVTPSGGAHRVQSAEFRTPRSADRCRQQHDARP